MNDHGIARKVRMRLRRHDGLIFLDRWGFEAERLGGVFLHKMSAPDPGIDLHDHPWWFVSIILRGGYTEERAAARIASQLAVAAERFPPMCKHGVVEHRRRWSIRLMRLTECHRITDLDRTPTWTLVIHGPNIRKWGFFLPSGWVNEHVYDQTVRAQRRDLWNEPV